jgi:heterodisulfide reductase subunit B
MLSVFAALQLPLTEIEDWNCCGATAYMSISELKAFALSARNFALAERQSADAERVDIVVPCAACYLGLNKALRSLNEHEKVRTKVKNALSMAGLDYAGRIRIRHPLDVLDADVGTEKLVSHVKRPLEGLKVACYYGCQIVRPFAEFDDQHRPYTMDSIMWSLGAEAVDWPLKTRCCGGSLTGTIDEVGLRLSFILLKEAKKRGCNVIATACPLCQFNLECYQTKMSRMFGEAVHVPVVYFTQLIGLALGISARKLGLQRSFVPLTIPDHMQVDAGGEYVHS